MTLMRMKHQAFVFLTALLVWCSSAFGSAPVMSISIQVVADGRLVASPTISIQSGKSAVVGMGDQLELEITASAGAKAADIRFKLHADVDGRFSLVGSPRLLAAYGELSTTQWKSDTGRTYMLLVTPTRVKPKGSKPR
jgi:hypothetical protein